MPGTSRLAILEDELRQRRAVLIRAILELPESAERHACAGALADLVRAEAAIATEYSRDGWLRAAELYRVNHVSALLDFERERAATT